MSGPPAGVVQFLDVAKDLGSDVVIHMSSGHTFEQVFVTDRDDGAFEIEDRTVHPYRLFVVNVAFIEWVALA